jgi:rhodanese-related sulfurtransferase
MTKRGIRQVSRSKQKRRWLWIGIGLGVAALIVVIGAVQLLNGDNKDTTTPPSLPLEVSDQEAASMRDQGAFVLDVRQPEEWADYHMPDSTLIPLGELSGRLSEVPTDREVVVVCRSGNRSAQGRDILLAAGYTQVTSLTGGLAQWRDQGYPTVTGP